MSSDIELKRSLPLSEENGHQNLGYAGSLGSVIDSKEISSQKNLTKSDGRNVDRKIASENDVLVIEGKYDETVEDDRQLGSYERWVTNLQESVYNGYEQNEVMIWQFIGLFLAGCYTGYFVYAMYYSFDDEGAHRLFGLTLFTILCFSIYYATQFFSKQLSSFGNSISRGFESRIWKKVIRWIIYGALVVALITFIIADIAVKQPYNLISAVGIMLYVLLFYVFSYNPARVKWRPVIWGIALQFIFGLLILRTRVGFEAFNWVGNRVTEFLEHTDAGSKFVFGESQYLLHFFAFKVLPVVVFFSTVTSILYYLGIIQVVIRGVAHVMQFFMGTTAGESLNAAGNIFIGQTEAPLLIRPLLNDMTRSELHAVMTGGFATIAGSVFGAYIAYGVPPNHLLSASVMSAPAALSMSKLFYPETEKSKTTLSDIQTMEKGNEVNVIQAASNGASASISLLANIAVNLIAFIALLHFLDATLTWFGHRVGLKGPHYPDLTFELICSYVFWPIAFFMGVDQKDCRNVARLIGVKTFLNEFVAYSKLSTLLENRKTYDSLAQIHGNNLTEQKTFSDLFIPEGNITLSYGYLTKRSEVIATYALCGFANMGSIGIMLGALGAMAPQRKDDIARTVVRAMIAGNVACFMTACIAGLLYEDYQ